MKLDSWVDGRKRKQMLRNLHTVEDEILGKHI